MHPSPSTRKGVAGFIKRRIRAADSQQGAQTLMLAASVTLLVASDHEQRAFLRPSEAAHRCAGGVVSVARLSSFLARRPHDSSPRGVDLAARDLWKLTAIAIVVNAVLAVSAYWVFSFIRIGPLQLLFIWFPLYLAAALPHLIEKSVRPYWSSRPRFEDGSVVIPGDHQSIALVTTGFLLYAFAGGTMAAGFTTGQPFHAALYVFAAASMAYLECSRNPGKDLVIALTDKQKTTLTPKGVSFHFPELLSVEEDSNDREATILWKDNVTIDIVSSPTIILNANPDTYGGPWGISSERIGIPFTGLDTLMRHFNEHPEDRPLLATPEGVDLVNDILAQARAALTTPQRSHA